MSDVLAFRPEVSAFGGGPSEAPADDTVVETAEPVAEKPAAKGEPAGAPERGADGKFLPRDGAEPKAKATKPAAAKVTAPEPAAEPEPTEEEAEEETEEEAPKPVATAELSKEDFLSLAKKHGFELDRAGRVTTAERHKFREEKRQQAEQIDQRARGYQQQLHGYMAELEQKQAAFAAQESRASDFDKAIEAGDFDAVAAATGRKDWQSLQQEILDRISDPTYKQMVELRDWKDQQEKEKQQQQTAWQRQQEQQREQVAQQEQREIEDNYKGQLSAQMASSKDPMVAAMHDDPVFIETIFQFQRKHFDAEARTAPSPEALIRRDEGGIRASLEKLHARLSKALGAPSAPPAREAAEASPEATKAAALSAPAPKGPPKQPSAKGSVGPSVAGKIDPTSPEWFAKWDEKFRQNREAERKGR